jgi:hypothetical protein
MCGSQEAAALDRSIQPGPDSLDFQTQLTGFKIGLGQSAECPLHMGDPPETVERDLEFAE